MLRYGDADRLLDLFRAQGKFDLCGWCGGSLATEGPDRSCPACGVRIRFEHDLAAAIETMPEEAARAAADPASRIGAYVCVSALGKGGFGTIHRAWDLRLSRWVALKVVRSPEDAPRFRREAQLAASLSHPNIAQVYDVGEEGDRSYIAMQLIEGRTAERLERSERRAAEAVRDAARAIQYAHDRGVLHRDLKPANVMIDSSGRLVVLDFGLARTIRPGDSLSGTGEILGTPGFMSPEQAAGRSTDARTDVYGLGATLYALLSGRAPHAGPAVLEILRCVIEEEPPSIRGDRDLATIVFKALEKNPSRRYATADGLADDLDRFLRGEPILARRPSVAYRFGKRLRRQPVAWTLGALLVAAVAGGAGFGVLQLAKSRSHYRRSLGLEQAARRRSELQEILERSRRRLGEIAEESAKASDDGELARRRNELRAMTRELACDEPALRFLRAEAWSLLGENLEAATDYSRAMEAPETEMSRSVAVRSLAALGRARARIRRHQESYLIPTIPGTGPLGPVQLEPMSLVLEDLRRVDPSTLSPSLRRLVSLWESLATGDLAAVQSGASLEIDRGGSNAEFYFLRGFVGGGARQIHDYDAAIDRDRGEARYYFCRALAWQPTDFRKARADYDEALRLRPGFVQAYCNRGQMRAEEGDVEGAMGDFARAIELAPDGVVAYVNRANLQRDLAAALADLDAALRIAPDNVYLLVNRGAARAAHGDVTGAVEEYTRAIAVDGTSSAAYTNRGEAYRALGKLEEARRDTNRAIELDPRNLYARVNLGILRRGDGDSRGAIEEYDRAIAIDSGFGLAYANRANARQDLGDIQGAILDFERAIELMPRDPRAKLFRERLETLRRR